MNRRKKHMKSSSDSPRYRYVLCGGLKVYSGNRIVEKPEKVTCKDCLRRLDATGGESDGVR